MGGWKAGKKTWPGIGRKGNCERAAWPRQKVAWRIGGKGQAYLLVSFILIMIISAVAFVSRTETHQRTEGHFLMENIKSELPLSYTAGIYQDDLNRILSETGDDFNRFSMEKGYAFKFVFAASYTRGASVHYIIGNWWGEDCTYYNTKKGPLTIANGETATFPRGWLNNDYSLIICGQTLDLTKDFDYRAEIHRQDEIVVSG